MSGEPVYRPATPGDLGAVERLLLESFPRLFTALMGDAPAERKLQTLLALRHTRADPAAGVFVAEAGGSVIGTMAYDSPALYSSGYRPGRLSALRQLGPLGALRFGVVARFGLLSQPPSSGELVIRSGAVVPEWRRHGVAARLLRTIEETTAADGYREYVGWVATTNEKSRQLMLASGYTEGVTRRHRLRGWLIGEPAMIRFSKPVHPHPTTEG